ncbi:ABC transporter permease [Paraglaciecola polaris]|uniref:ABC transporter ATP-binding protein n=1 Tax=Paraglaciecola polaris LMG 21857 TaxID=1129793 RepID=K6ZV42_9ALTE|nr:ABC transporter permease [Paraglaciecola polaris]GAC32663.1 ABC transporter ATP-binding protein [Paraglaciecola polaris LMG 21857]
MFNYYLKLAFKSFRRNPILTGLMIAAIALGIGASMTTITVNYLMSADPIPSKSGQLFHVQVDSWDPNNGFNDEPNTPPNQLTWTEATNLMAAQQAFRQTAMAKSGAIIEPQNSDINPFEASIRLTFNDFFPMFNVPFKYGNGWDKKADDDRQMVVVLSKNTNDKVFAGQNSVGNNIVIDGKSFRVIGVLDTWQPLPKFYDVNNGAFDEPEELFMPFYLKQELELPNWGNTNCWKTPEGEGFAAFLQSECINFQMWVELPTEKDKQDYLTFLNNYVNDQKALGRFPRPMNNHLLNVMQWMDDQEVVAEDAQIMMWLSFMFLLVCLLNTIGLQLAKFSAKSAEIGLRRAVGATKGDLFIQYTIETAAVGIAGGILGLALALLGLVGIRQLYGDVLNDLANLDATMIGLALTLSLLASICAGLYPTWRACNIAPASQLKSQ